MIRWTKKEGGHGRVLWIEESSVHPRSGSEHGRSAQQELLLEWGVWAGTPATYLSSTPVQTPSWRYVPTYLRTFVPFLLRAQLARATRGGARVLLAECSETVASYTHGRVGRRARDAIIGSCPGRLGRPGALPLAAGFFSCCSIPTA